jgi:uncharacterized protein YpuA (DUF1002 family)
MSISLIKDCKGRSPYWFVAYTAPDGWRRKKSTKKRNKQEAWQVALSFIEIENAVHSKEADEAQVRKIVDSALKPLGHGKLTETTIRQVLDNWLASKKGETTPATMKAYQQAVSELVSFLGQRADESARSSVMCIHQKP